MKYNNKGYCEGCNQLTWVRSDKLQGVVCKCCDEPTLSFKQNKHRIKDDYSRFDSDSFELYPRRRRAV